MPPINASKCPKLTIPGSFSELSGFHDILETRLGFTVLLGLCQDRMRIASDEKDILGS